MAGELIKQAMTLHKQSLVCWHNLRDLGPAHANNDVLDGKEHNYRAAESRQLLIQLEAGVL